jgi:F0F1-type ATP synthase assembly protein I
MTVAAFTKGFLRSPWYPLVGGSLIGVFALLQYHQTQNPWFLLGTVVGVGFGVYGVVDPLNDARTQSE